VNLKQRVLVLVDVEVQMPESLDKADDKWIIDHKTEYDVVTALNNLGHEVRILGGVTELRVVKEALTDWQPHIIFNLLEQFFGENFYVPYLLGYLELMHQPFTGCNPSGLLFAYNKPLMKKILAFHRIPTPHFKVFPVGKGVRRPRSLPYPLIVKSTSEHGSEGISQASVVTNDEKLRERVEFIHAKLQTDAMAEEYIEGRELYVGVLGNQRLESFPIWEIQFGNLPEGSQPIATSKIKWDTEYRKKLGVSTGAAKDLPPGFDKLMDKLCRRIYSILGFCGYARMDFRLTEGGKIYLIEPNPNPDLGRDEDFAESGYAAGVNYEELIRRVIHLGLRSPAGRNGNGSGHN
jgi:D-alanine-D-alanine ligase